MSAEDLEFLGFRGRLFDALGRAESGEDKVSSGCFAARVSRLSCSLDSLSGRVLEISTNQPGIQFYDGEYLNGYAITRTRTPGSLEIWGRLKPGTTDFEEVHVVVRQKQTGSSRNVEDTLPLKQFKGGNKATTF